MSLVISSCGFKSFSQIKSQINTKEQELEGGLFSQRSPNISEKVFPDSSIFLCALECLSESEVKNGNILSFQSKLSSLSQLIVFMCRS